MVVNVKTFKGSMIGEGVKIHDPVVKKEKVISTFKQIYGPKMQRQ